MKADISIFMFFPMQGSMCIYAAEGVEDPILPPVGSEYQDPKTDRQGAVIRHVYTYEPLPVDQGGGHKAVIKVFVQ